MIHETEGAIVMDVSLGTGIVGDSTKVPSHDEEKINTITTLVATRAKEFDEDALRKKERATFKKNVKDRKKAEEGKHTVNSNITADSTEDSIMPATSSPRSPSVSPPRSPSAVLAPLLRPAPMLRIDLNNMPLTHASAGEMTLEEITQGPSSSLANTSSAVSDAPTHALLRNDPTATSSVQTAILASIRQDNIPVLSRDLNLDTDGSSPDVSDMDVSDVEVADPDVSFLHVENDIICMDRQLHMLPVSEYSEPVGDANSCSICLEKREAKQGIRQKKLGNKCHVWAHGALSVYQPVENSSKKTTSSRRKTPTTTMFIV